CHLNLITADFNLRVPHLFTSPDVVPPSMPRTLHDLTCERAFAQWSSSMWTGIPQRIDLALYVKERHADPFRLDGQPNPWLEVCDFGDSDTLGHRPLSLGLTDRYRVLAY